jgi:hypothetical protein
MVETRSSHQETSGDTVALSSNRHFVVREKCGEAVLGVVVAAAVLAGCITRAYGALASIFPGP